MVVGLAVPLGAIEREVGVLHQGDAVRPVTGRDGDADAGGTDRLMAAQIDRTFETGLDLVGERGEILVRIDALDQHREFVPAEPRDLCLGQVLAQVNGGFAQQRIARRMAHRVVDDLEIVEVDIGDQDLIVVPPQRQRLVQLLDEQLAVGQPRQPVMQADMDDLALALGDRLDHAVEIGREAADLVLALDRERRILPAREFTHCDIEAVERPRDAAGDTEAERDDERQSGGDDGGEQIAQRGILRQGFGERMLEHEARLDPVLQGGQARDVIEAVVLPGRFDDLAIRAFRGPVGQVGLRRDARLHVDRAQLRKAVHLPGAERLRHHQPAYEIGHFDRRGRGEREFVTIAHQALLVAVIQRPPDRIHRGMAPTAIIHHRPIETDHESRSALGARPKRSQRARDRRAIAGGDRFAKTEIARQDLRRGAHLLRAQVEDFVDDLGVRREIAGCGPFAEPFDALADEDHDDRHDQGEQDREQDRDPQPQGPEAQAREPVEKYALHRRLTASRCLFEPPEIVTVRRISLPGARRRGCQTVMTAEPLGTASSDSIPL